MFGFSLGEVLFLGVLALLVIGPKQLPEVARHIAKFLNELRRTADGVTREFKQQVKLDLNLDEKLPQIKKPEAYAKEFIENKIMGNEKEEDKKNDHKS